MEHLQKWRERKKQLGLTNQDIANLSGLPLRTVEQIMCGKVKHPRLDTVRAIEKALGLDEKTPSDEELSEGERELMEMVSQLTDEEIREIAQFIEFLVSKRKN